MRFLEKAVRLDPSNHINLSALNQVYKKTNNAKRSIKFFHALCDKYPRNLYALNLLAVAFQNGNQAIEGAVYVGAKIGYLPREALIVFAKLIYSTGDVENAVAIMKKSFEIKSDEAVFY
jgi:tetratricopeptide (TPR) repeat protein